jgi:nucleoside-diphosphate-sugar epimerase
VQPSVVYGLASGPLVAAGLADRQSIAIPLLIQASAARRRAGIFGEGTNVLPYVHIDDMADLYITLLDAILDPRKLPGHGWNGYYFGETGLLPYIDVSQSIGKALVELGYLEPGAEIPTPFSQGEVSEYFAGVCMCSFFHTTC